MRKDTVYKALLRDLKRFLNETFTTGIEEVQSFVSELSFNELNEENRKVLRFIIIYTLNKESTWATFRHLPNSEYSRLYRLARSM